MDTCSPCQRKARSKAWAKNNPERIAENREKWKEANPEKYKLSQQKWEKNNPEKLVERSARWRANNPEKYRKIVREHYHNNREACIRRVVERNAKYRTPVWANLDTIAEIYSFSRSLTIDFGIKYHVDHIVPLKGKEVCGLHVENNLRVILAVDNMSKSNKFSI